MSDNLNSSNVALPASTTESAGLNLDPAALALPQHFQDNVQVQKLLTHVPVGKPNSKAFIRVHKDPEYCLTTSILDLKDDGIFIVTPRMRNELAAEIWPATIFTYITRQNQLGLWVVKLAGPDGRINHWHESAMAGAKAAMDKWTRIQANMNLGSYEILVAQGQLSDPVWPSETFSQILSIGLKDKLIDSPEHVICKKLRGQI